MNQKSYESGAVLENLNLMRIMKKSFCDVFAYYARINITIPSQKCQDTRKGCPYPPHVGG